jgi:dihydroxyacetone synthase
MKDALVQPVKPVSAEKLTNGQVKGWKGHLDDDDRAVLALRNLIFDICNQNGGGHGGSAIGMAAIGVALYKYVMRYNPSNPEWFDRDRFVLSNGAFLNNIRKIPFPVKSHTNAKHVSRSHGDVLVCPEPSRRL